MDKLLAAARDWLLPLPRPLEDVDHLEGALGWLYRAQDAGRDRGVSHSYAIGRGWTPSYPETTGYIIPTLLNVAEARQDREAGRRALEMADWECGLQLEPGCIPSISDGAPVVFDTGQVVFGWIRAWEVTGSGKYLDAAMRAAEWLVGCQDDDGAWRVHGNPGSDGLHVYNARVAWAVGALGRALQNDRYIESATRFLEWALTEESGPGWFAHNCLNDNERPLLHTIAYTAQGFLEAGLLLGEQRFVDAARRTAEVLRTKVGEDGRMAGRFDRDWRATVPWSCLTGMAQTSLVWQRLDRTSGEKQYEEVVDRVHVFLKRTQDLGSANAGIRGGIKGSHPVYGGYAAYRLPNWAAKFFVDALLLHASPGSNLPLYR